MASVSLLFVGGASFPIFMPSPLLLLGCDGVVGVTDFCADLATLLLLPFIPVGLPPTSTTRLSFSVAVELWVFDWEPEGIFTTTSDEGCLSSFIATLEGVPPVIIIAVIIATTTSDDVTCVIIFVFFVSFIFSNPFLL